LWRHPPKPDCAQCSVTSRTPSLIKTLAAHHHAIAEQHRRRLSKRRRFIRTPVLRKDRTITYKHHYLSGYCHHLSKHLATYQNTVAYQSRLLKHRRLLKTPLYPSGIW